MPDIMFQALDLTGLGETAEQVRAMVQEAKSEIEAELDSLDYAQPDGIYPDMTVGAVIGPDTTAQWSTRESTGTGIATVRSVQGAAEVQNGELVPVQIAGIQSTDANGDALDSVEWPTFTLRGAGAIGDMLYSDHVETRVGVVDLGALTWIKGNALTDETGNVFYAVLKTAPVVLRDIPLVQCAELTPVAYSNPYEAITKGDVFVSGDFVVVGGDSALNASQFKTSMDGILLWYQLFTSTTTPVDPTLPMTYHTEQGGAESIIVPEVQISAAPILTIADPVNMSTELALIWTAIEALQGGRGTTLANVRNDLDVSSPDEKEAPTMDERQITERESDE